jgi:hypothetical protein
MGFDELHHFPMLRPDGRRERLQQREYFRPVYEIPAGEFTDDERMAKRPAFSQQGFQPNGSMPQMRHPN